MPEVVRKVENSSWVLVRFGRNSVILPHNQSQAHIEPEAVMLMHVAQVDKGALQGWEDSKAEYGEAWKLQNQWQEDKGGLPELQGQSEFESESRGPWSRMLSWCKCILLCI